VHQALRRHVALAHRAPAARQVAHVQPAALQQRLGHALEEGARHRALGRADDLHAAHQRVASASVPAQHLVDAVQQRLQVAADHALGVQLRQQLVRHQQAVELALVEPQAGQLVLRWPR
jgi:hypothetical protein